VARIEELICRVENTRRLRYEVVEKISSNLTAAVLKAIRKNNDDQKEMTLGDILLLVQYGTSTKAASEPKGLPIIRMGNIQKGKIKTTDLKYVDLPSKEVAKYLLEKGDILINRTNSAELVGKAGLFDLDSRYIFASYLIRLRVKSDIVDPAYINYCINSSDGQAYLKSQGKDAIGQTNVNTRQIRQMPLSLPTIPEQRRIVEYLNSLQSKAEELKRLQAETEAELATFTPALLAKAFRGEL